MIRYCLEKWDKNKELLKDRFESFTQEKLYDISYRDLVVDVVNYIYNDGDDEIFDPDKITEIDNGDYQGTLLYLIPWNTYQPCEYDYLMTYVGYGSCSGCDTLQAIISAGFDSFSSKDNLISEKTVRDLMVLCKDLITNTIKPYNTGWRHNEMFEEIKL